MGGPCSPSVFPHGEARAWGACVCPKTTGLTSDRAWRGGRAWAPVHIVGPI